MGEPIVVLPSTDAPPSTAPDSSWPTGPPTDGDRPTPPLAQVPIRRLGGAASNAESVESHFWLTRADQLVFGLLSLITLVLLGVYWVRLSNWGAHTVEIDRLPERQLEYRIDLNSATWVEWSQLDGVGDALAHRIVAEREQNGPFESVDDLRRVRGIGPRTLEKLRPWVRLVEEPQPPGKPGRRKR